MVTNHKRKVPKVICGECNIPKEHFVTHFPKNTQIAQFAIVSKSKGTNADVLTGNMDHHTHYLNPRNLEIP